MKNYIVSEMRKNTEIMAEMRCDLLIRTSPILWACWLLLEPSGWIILTLISIGRTPLGAWSLIATVSALMGLLLCLAGCAERQPTAGTPIYLPAGTHTTDQMVDAVNAWELTPEGRRSLGNDAGKP